MNYQHRYQVSFGHPNQLQYDTLEVYAFDAKAAIETALYMMRDAPTIPQITKVELVK